MSEAPSETKAIPVPPGFIELTGAFGAATILLHHSQVGEVADRRGAHGTPRPTVIRHRTQRRKWEVEQTAADVRRAIHAALMAEAELEGLTLAQLCPAKPCVHLRAGLVPS